MMFRLPPPPRFTLPPPPPLMLSSDTIDTKHLVQWTCSSIRQHQPSTNPRLILISCISFFMFTLMFTILFMLIQFYRRRKSLLYTYESKPPSLAASGIMTSNNLSMTNSRYYETISTEHTSDYIYSIDTSVTTYATDSNNTACCHCHQECEYSNSSLSMSTPLYYQIFDS